MIESRHTALTSTHQSLGAKMVDFAGFSMPVRYTSVIEEHKAVRENAGVFDVSHMGEFVISGPDAINLIQLISSNDASVLTPGQAQYSCMPNETGGIVDDLIIYCLEKEKYLLVVNASNIQKDWEWISAHNRWGASMEDISNDMSLLAVQGPRAGEILQPLTNVILDEIKYYTFRTGNIGSAENVIISATGYTGSGGFELYIPNEVAKEVWEAIFSFPEEGAVRPIGLGARDTLRLEMGYCLYGNDIDDQTSPLEAGLGWITKFNHDFINAAGLLKQKEGGLTKKLVGFEMKDKGIPRSGYPIENSEGEVIGHVTSGTMSPSLEKGIGLGYINFPYHKRDTEVFIRIRKNALAATVCKLPFYNK